MKKITILLTTLILSCPNASLAQADTYQYKPYIGLDYLYNRISAKQLSPYNNAFSLRIGSDYSRYFSSELFLTQSDSQSKYPRGEKFKSSYRAYGLDVVGYLPIAKFSFLATVGIGEYVFKMRLYPEKHHNEHGYGYRFGGGLKYAVDEHWQSRTICRYVKFNHVHQYNHAVEYTTGVEYHF